VVRALNIEQSHIPYAKGDGKEISQRRLKIIQSQKEVSL